MGDLGMLGAGAEVASALAGGHGGATAVYGDVEGADDAWASAEAPAGPPPSEDASCAAFPHVMADVQDADVAVEPAAPHLPAADAAAAPKGHAAHGRKKDATSSAGTAAGGYARAAAGHQLSVTPARPAIAAAEVSGGASHTAVALSNHGSSPVTIGGITQVVTAVDGLARPVGDFVLQGVAGGLAIPAGGVAPLLAVTFRPLKTYPEDLTQPTQRRATAMILDAEHRVIGEIELEGVALPSAGAKAAPDPSTNGAAQGRQGSTFDEPLAERTGRYEDAIERAADRDDDRQRAMAAAYADWPRYLSQEELDAYVQRHPGFDQKLERYAKYYTTKPDNPYDALDRPSTDVGDDVPHIGQGADGQPYTYTERSAQAEAQAVLHDSDDPRRLLATAYALSMVVAPGTTMMATALVDGGEAAVGYDASGRELSREERLAKTRAALLNAVFGIEMGPLERARPRDAMRTLSETEARGVGPTGANFEPVLEAEAGASEAAEVSVDGTAASATDSHASPVEADQVQPAKPDASTAGPTPAPTEVTTTEAARPTIPSGKPNPDAKPRGRVTKINPKDTPANQVAYARENESAELLAKQGYDVEQNPPSPAGSRKNPDYKIEGEYFDNYAPTAKSPRSIWTGVGKKVKKDQAARIVLNLDDNAVDLDALAKQFAEWPIDGLEQVLVVRQGTVSQLVP